MRIARRILLFMALLLAAAVAVGCRTGNRRSFEHWFRHLPVVGDVRISGMRGTLFIAVRREVDSGMSSSSGRFGNAEKNWGFSWQSAVTLDVYRDPPDFDPRSINKKSLASLAPNAGAQWIRIDLVGVPFWGALAAALFMVVALAAPEVAGPWLRRRRRRGGGCGNCGYNLTGNESGVCPECGNASSARGAAVAADVESIPTLAE